MLIENNTLLYFSGTGNSLQVAKDICGRIKGLELKKAAPLIDEDKVIVKAEILGIVFPVYYARLPLIIEKIVKKLELGKGVYVFAVATHGGAPATVLKRLEGILQSKGALLNAGFIVQMPKNHVLEYNTKPVEADSRIFANEKKKVEKISRIVSNKINHKCEISKLIIDTIIDKVFAAATNKIFDNLNMSDAGFWVNESCDGCKLCEKVCSVKNIEFNIKPIWKHNCERCMACISFCPKEAIQWKDKTAKRNRYKNPNVDIKDLT